MEPGPVPVAVASEPNSFSSKQSYPCISVPAIDLSPCTLDLDHQTAIHFWTTHHRRRFHKPNLVIIHGYGGDSGWCAEISQNFNLYIPDLLFFGEWYTRRGNYICMLHVTGKNYRKEKQELVEHLMAKKLNINLFPVRPN